jgi:hypothetical protein
MTEVDESFTNRQTRERVTLWRNYPSEFLGRDDEPVQGVLAAGDDPRELLLRLGVLGKLAEAARQMEYGQWTDQVLIEAEGLGLLPTSPEYASLIRAASDEAGLYRSLREG